MSHYSEGKVMFPRTRTYGTHYSKSTWPWDMWNDLWNSIDFVNSGPTWWSNTTEAINYSSTTRRTWLILLYCSAYLRRLTSHKWESV